MEALPQALESIFCWQGLTLVFAGSMLALLMGMLPGLSSTEAMLILLPFTFSLNLSDSMMLLNGAYASAFVGGAVTSIMFGIPGSSTTIATVLDGYPMRQQGKGLVAIGAANMSSMFGGLFSIVLVIVLLPFMGPVSLMFGPPEWFVFVLFGLIILSFAGEGTFPRAMMSAALGILAGTIGLSEVTGDARFSFDIAFLWGGIPIIPAFIGLYPFAEAIDLIDVKMATAEDDQQQLSTSQAFKDVFAGSKLAFKHFDKTMLGSFTGWFIGVIPGVGATLANMMSYILAKQLSKDPQSFGKGNPQGVIAAEAGNNASVGGALIPALALGIPGSLNTAILLSIFLINGIQPGTNVFQNNLDVTWVILLSVFMGTILSSAVIMVGGWQIARILQNLDIKLIVPVVVFIGGIASYLSRGNIFDLVISLVLGLIGFGMKKYQFSRISFIIALMLGPLLESSFFQALSIGRGSISIFFKGPVVLSLWVVTVVVSLFFFWKLTRTRLEQKKG